MCCHCDAVCAGPHVGSLRCWRQRARLQEGLLQCGLGAGGLLCCGSQPHLSAAQEFEFERPAGCWCCCICSSSVLGSCLDIHCYRSHTLAGAHCLLPGKYDGQAGQGPSHTQPRAPCAGADDTTALSREMALEDLRRFRETMLTRAQARRERRAAASAGGHSAGGPGSGGPAMQDLSGYLRGAPLQGRAAQQRSGHAGLCHSGWSSMAWVVSRGALRLGGSGASCAQGFVPVPQSPPD